MFSIELLHRGRFSGSPSFSSSNFKLDMHWFDSIRFAFGKISDSLGHALNTLVIGNQFESTLIDGRY